MHFFQILKLRFHETLLEIEIIQISHKKMLVATFMGVVERKK
jgi:hypothetical protein